MAGKYGRKATGARKLRLLVLFLTVILAVVLCVAVALHIWQQNQTPSEDTLHQTENTQQTEFVDPTTEPTAEQTQPTTLPATQPEETIPTTEPPETTEPDQPQLVIPDNGVYVDVGEGYIAEVITYTAETFNGQTNDDYSAPIRNFLPKGTVDYASTQIISNSTMDYVLLRCGRRVYLEKNDNPYGKLPVVECYAGTLPDHNEIGFVSMAQEDHFTILTLDVLWKAPFFVDLAPQSYINPSTRDYRVTAFTAEYIDITFCYATSFSGSVTIDAGNPLFSSAEVTMGEADCTLRLHLKKTGGFYGYDSYYDENNRLCLKFLNPIKAAATTANAYGADLTGIRIMIDVGHGGVDCGSVGTTASGAQVTEADLNLALAEVLQQELESMGATVILNRSDDTTLSVDARTEDFKQVWPDICICIHQNSSSDSSARGLQVCYSTPVSHDLAALMYEYTMDTGLYSSGFTSWHYYYVAKQTNCPVVLMENGYISNASDLEGMLDDGVLLQKAQAMAGAVADYFLGSD